MTTSPSLIGCSDPRQLRGKPRIVLFALVALWALLLLVTQSRWRSAAPQLYALIRQFGIVLILLGVGGRTWWTFNTPAGNRAPEPRYAPSDWSFLFTAIAAAGIGAQGGSLLLAALFPAMLIVCHIRARRDAAVPPVVASGDPATRTAPPTFFPRLAGRDADRPLQLRFLRRALFDGCLFLAAVPVADALIWLNGAGGLALIAWLP